MKNLIATCSCVNYKAWGSILKRLKCNNLSSLRSYFSAFVASQLYGHIFVEIELERIREAIGIFMRKIFSLPSSFPFVVSEAILGLKPFETTCFYQRVSYFRRTESQTDTVTFGSLSTDRCELMKHDIGISAVFGRSLVKLSLPYFSDYEDVSLYEKVSRIVLDSFKNSLMRSEANIFWSQLEIDGRIPPELASIFSALPYEQARILLLFLGNMLRWSALTQPSEVCFLCPAKFYSTHFFACGQVQTSSSLSDFSSAIINREYVTLVKRIFVTLNEWTTAHPGKFVFRFRWNVLSFFDNVVVA